MAQGPSRGAPHLLLAVGAFFPRTGKDRHQERSEAIATRASGVVAWSLVWEVGTARWSCVGAEAEARQSGQQSRHTVSSRAHVPGSHALGAATLTYPGARR